MHMDVDQLRGWLIRITNLMYLDLWWSRTFLFSLFGLFEEAYGRNTLEVFW